MLLQTLLYFYFQGLVWSSTTNPFSGNIYGPSSVAFDEFPTATIDSGLIVGTNTIIQGATVTVNKFLGIPYASAPTGVARFSPSIPHVTWNGTLDTTKVKNSCIQVFHSQLQGEYLEDIFGGPKAPESEDCLFLNVYTPRKASGASKSSLPILYWIHPGASTFGNIVQPMYDGSHFAAFENVIVVTVQYRFDVFGFPQSPEISNFTERNLGLLDQRAGLDWVHRNIASFGGDRSKITVVGASFGSLSTDALITSYSSDSKTPFRAAILMSGVYAWYASQKCNDTDSIPWDTFASSLNCTTLQCVKGKPATEIRTARQNQPYFFNPACDNITYVQDPRLRKTTGNFARVPVMLGSSTGDGSYFISLVGGDVDAYFRTFLPGQTELRQRALASYPIGSEGRVDTFTQLSQIHTDWSFRCPAFFNAQASAAFVPAYRYIYGATFPNTRQFNPNITALWPLKYQGAWHTSELADVFSTYATAYPSVDAPPEEKALSSIVRGAWAAFAKDPTSAPVEGWKIVGPKGDNVLVFGADGASAVESVKDGGEKCEVWKEFLETNHL